VKYFAYGSNMYKARLIRRISSAKFLFAACLKGHDLKFNKKSNDGSGKCNIQGTDNPDDVVYGVVFEMDPKDTPALDNAEGQGYSKKYVRVISDEVKDGEIEVFTYQAQPLFINDSLKPYDWYKELVVAGAKEHRLPESYVKMLESVRAMKDPDEGRTDKNRENLKSCNQSL